MAEGKNNRELKAEAIANLAASRAEMSTDLSTLRHDLSPRHVAHRMVDRHKTVMVGAAAAALAAVLLVCRQAHAPKRSYARYERRPSDSAKAGPGIMPILAQAIIPILIKSVLSPGLIQALLAKRYNGSGRAE